MVLAPVPALAQSGGDAQPLVELGLGGNLVAEAWNPVRVTVHDVGPSTLRLRIDEGSLLEGPRIVHYTASVPGGSGVTVFDDDVFVPSFRSLSWTLTRGATMLASGSLAAADSDDRPLDVLLSSSPGTWRAAFGADARIVDVAASDLPTRAAAYDGVAAILVDGSAAAPRAEAVAAAAAGGVQVLLAGELPASQASIGSLAGAGRMRLGAGEVMRVGGDVGAVRTALADWTGQDRGALIQALAVDPLLHAPRGPGQPLVLSLAVAYVLVTLLGLRFGKAPGLAAGVVLAVVVSFAGWRLLRPPAPVLSGARTLELGGGELALDLPVDERLTLPAGTVTIDGAGHPLSPLPYAVENGATRVDLPRWHAVAVVGKPVLRPASLRFEGDMLRNAGREPLTDVVVLGLGHQRNLAPGAVARIQPGEEGALPPELVRLAKLLPAGTAVAVAPASVLVALPASSAGGGP